MQRIQQRYMLQNPAAHPLTARVTFVALDEYMWWDIEFPGLSDLNGQSSSVFRAPIIPHTARAATQNFNSGMQPSLLVVSRGYGKILCRELLGTIFQYSLTISKQIHSCIFDSEGIFALTPASSEIRAFNLLNLRVYFGI